MNSSHLIKSGVHAVVIMMAVSTPLFVSAAESAIPVESREQSAAYYQAPVELDNRGREDGMEQQYQLQLLQQEVMELRGIVETLKYELQQMKSLQDDRYLELDGRLQQALQARPVNQESGQVAGNPEPVTADVSAVGMSEKELYDTTRQLIRNRQYDLAITQLESLISRFPDGGYTPNAYYWLGQVHAARPDPDFEKARQALAQVISYFPDHSKVPDAAFALGKVYHTLGDCERASNMLQQVIDQYPGKSAARLAENYLRESVSCE